MYIVDIYQRKEEKLWRSLRRDVFRGPRRVEVGPGVEAREERLPRRVRHRLWQKLQSGRKGVHVLLPRDTRRAI